jgi:DNA-binding SARP family transcriptional activator
MWGSTDSEPARHNLRQTLLAFRQELPRSRPPILLTEADAVAVNAVVDAR